jgi:hypothetical protein
MTPKLKQYLNRSIMISIPALFKHGKCRPYTLQSIEADGLWLASTALVGHLLPEKDNGSAAENSLVYVPNAQIAALILPALASIASPENTNETKTATPEAPKPTSTTAT